MPDNEMGIPDIYVDSSRVTVGAYGVNLTFGLAEAHPSQGGVPRTAVDKVRIRMSLQHAKVMAMLLRKQLKLFEESASVDIQLPPGLYTGLGIAEEDWR
jgi:hypothetical protein